jgi:hypothetical protein
VWSSPLRTRAFAYEAGIGGIAQPTFGDSNWDRRCYENQMILRDSCDLESIILSSALTWRSYRLCADDRIFKIELLPD